MESSFTRTGSSDADLLRLLEPTDALFDFVAAHGDEVIAVGPFRAIIDPHTAELWASQAMPVDALRATDETLQQLQGLGRLFTQRNRIPNVEFNEPVWPELPELLQRAGFVEYDREPIMLCTPDTFRPSSSPDVAVRFLQPADPETDLVAFQTIFSEVLVGKPYEARPERLSRFRAEIERVGGQGHALAEMNGVPVGTGFISSAGMVGEITRVATVPAARRRGVAATLTSFMLRHKFERGGTLIWLTAEDRPAQALYKKLGFRLVGERLYYKLPQ